MYHIFTSSFMCFRNSAWCSTTDTVCDEGTNFPVRNRPPVVSSCSNCRLVNVYLTFSDKARIFFMLDIGFLYLKNVREYLKMIIK